MGRIKRKIINVIKKKSIKCDQKFIEKGGLDPTRIQYNPPKGGGPTRHRSESVDDFIERRANWLYWGIIGNTIFYTMMAGFLITAIIVVVAII